MMTNVFMNESVVKSVVANFVAAQRGVCIVADCVVKAASLINKADEGRLVKVCMWIDRPLVSYKGSVDAKADEKIEPKAPKGFTFTKYPYFKRADKTGIEYLNINYRDCDKADYCEKYYLDGELIDEATALSLQKPKKTYAPKTQINVGVKNPNEFTKVVAYELGKIRYIGADKAKAIETYESVGD